MLGIASRRASSARHGNPGLGADDTALTFLGDEGSRRGSSSSSKTGLRHENTHYRERKRKFQRSADGAHAGSSRSGNRFGRRSPTTPRPPIVSIFEALWRHVSLPRVFWSTPGGEPLIGPAAIEAGLGAQLGGSRDRSRPMPTHVRHHVSSVRFAGVARDRVDVTSYFAVHTDVGLDHWGRYRDVLIPRGWSLAVRVAAGSASTPSLP